MAKRFKIALTYSGELRQFVGSIASELSRKLSKKQVFYDRNFTAELARPNLDTYLQNIYYNQTELIVVFLSKDYEEKQWCGLEFRAIRDLIKQQRDQQVMFVRMDAGKVAGTFAIDGYVDGADQKPKEIAKLILQRLELIHDESPLVRISPSRNAAVTEVAKYQQEIRASEHPTDSDIPKLAVSFSDSLNPRQIEFRLEISRDEFDLATKSVFIEHLAALLGTTPNQLKIGRVKFGSVRIEIEFPDEESVTHFLRMMDSDDASQLQFRRAWRMNEILVSNAREPSGQTVPVLSDMTRLQSSPVSQLLPESDKNNIWFYDNDSDCVFVFVHGVLSDSRDCWLNLDQAPWVYWPSLILSDSRFHMPSIFLAGYHTAIDSGSFGIRECAEEVLNSLKLQSAVGIPPVLDKQKITFICHSTGGIVVRYLLESNADAFKKKDVGLVLIASPSYGSELATKLDWLAKLYEHRVGKQLQWASWGLQDLDDRFRNLINKKRIPKLRGLEFYEHHFVVHWKWMPLFSTRKVVTKESAGRYFGAAQQLAKTNHFTCVKPRSVEESSHKYLLEFVQREKLIPADSGGRDPIPLCAFGIPELPEKPSKLQFKRGKTDKRDYYRRDLIGLVIVFILFAVYLTGRFPIAAFWQSVDGDHSVSQLGLSEFRRLVGDFYVEQHWKHVDNTFLNPSNADKAIHTVWEKVAVSLPSIGTPTHVSDLYTSALRHGTDYLEPILCGKQIDAAKPGAEFLGPGGLTLHTWMRQVEESKIDLGLPFGERACNWWLLFLALDTEISVELFRDDEPVKLSSGQELTPDQVLDLLRGKKDLDPVDLPAANLRLRNRLKAFQKKVQSNELHVAWYRENQERIKSTHRQMSSKYADLLSDEYARYLRNPSNYSIADDHNVIAEYLKSEMGQRFAIAASASRLHELAELCDRNGWHCVAEVQDGVRIVSIEPSLDRHTAAWTEILQCLASMDIAIELKLVALPPDEYSLSDVWKLKKLRRLDIKLNNSLITPEKLIALNDLQQLVLIDCDHVAQFHDGAKSIPSAVLCNLRFLSLNGSAKWITSMEDLACFPNLEQLDLANRSSTISLKGVGLLKSLEKLSLTEIGMISDIGEITGSTELRQVECQTTSFEGGSPPEIDGFKLQQRIGNNVAYIRVDSDTSVNKASE